MKQWRPQHPVNVMARVFAVSRSGFYKWLKGIPLGPCPAGRAAQGRDPGRPHP